MQCLDTRVSRRMGRNRRSVMIEREPEYQADIKNRMATTADLLTAAE